MNTAFAVQRTCRLGAMVILLIVSAACDKIDSQDEVMSGDFPLIRLQGLDRPDTVMPAFRGKVVLVNVWATWCPPCRKEMPALERLHVRLDSSRAAVIGLSVEDDGHQVREWLKQSNITFANYLDTGIPSGRELLRIATYPQTFLVAPDGRMIARFEGARDWDDPKWLALIDRAWSKSQATQ